MPHISNMYFLEEVITVRSLRSAVAQEFRKIPTDDLKVRSSFFAGWCVMLESGFSTTRMAYGIRHERVRTVRLPAGVGGV